VIRSPHRSLAAVVAGLALASCGEDLGPPAEPYLTLDVMGPSVFAPEVDTDLPLSVRVREEGGPPRTGVAVTWGVIDGGGAIASGPTSSTDEYGGAQAIWRIGTEAGAQRAMASIETRGRTVVANFVAEAHAGPPAVLTLSADSILINAVGEAVHLAPAFSDVHGNVAGAPPTPVLWSSSEPDVASVGSDGLVTGRAEGTTYVNGSLGSSTDSLLVTVSLRGAITVTFDDGWRTTYTQAFPLFQEFALPANVGVNPGAVTWPAFLDESQLQELHEAGWSMVSHTMSHAYLPDLTDEELDHELRGAREFLDTRSFRGSDVFIVPYHDWGLRERTAVAKYYRAARGVAANYFSPIDSLVRWMPPDPFDLTGMEAADLPFTTVEGRDRLRALLQRTVDEGVFLDLFFHQVPPEDVQALRETLSVLDAFRDRVLPYHELFPESPREVR
jgi:peptidoglycan/xylan/chitin deacetylase (PgdA/CDA1 family)